MNNTLVVVHCYSGDKAQVEEFLPYWLHHDSPVLILSPADAKVKIEHPEVLNASAGKKGWKGQHTIVRQIRHWKLALKQPQEWFFLNDSDSLCISRDLPDYLYADPYKLWCNVLCHEWEHQEDDHPNLNPPYFMHRNVLEALVKEATNNPELDEAHVTPDHDHSNETPQDNTSCDMCYWQAIDGLYTNLVINRLQIPYETFPDGATTWPRGLSEMMEAVERRGARFIHGIKHNSQLNALALSYRAWVINNETQARLAVEQSPMQIGDTIRV